MLGGDPLGGVGGGSPIGGVLKGDPLRGCWEGDPGGGWGGDPLGGCWEGDPFGGSTSVDSPALHSDASQTTATKPLTHSFGYTE